MWLFTKNNVHRSMPSSKITGIDCCRQMANFSWRKQVSFQWDDDDGDDEVRFVQDQHFLVAYWLC